MAKSRKCRKCNFNPASRMGKVVTLKCDSCDNRKLKLIANYTKEKGAEMDALIESLKG